MAASALDRDYVHRVAAAIEARSGRSVQVIAENIADFERGFATWDDQVRLARWREFEPDLVVLAIGENVAAFEDQATQEQFRESVASLLQALARGHGRPAILVRSCFWPEPVRDGLLHQACARVGGTFVDVSGLSQDESNAARSEREYVHAGVGAHPGDRGMQRLADLLLAALGIGSADPD
jgi:lysophospholipase L1-like esterase